VTRHLDRAVFSTSQATDATIQDCQSQSPVLRWRGFVVNGLVNLIRPSKSAVPLDRCYAECVIVRPGSFMNPVRKAEGFANAVRKKLLFEVRPHLCLSPETSRSGTSGRLYGRREISELSRTGISGPQSVAEVYALMPFRAKAR